MDALRADTNAMIAAPFDLRTGWVCDALTFNQPDCGGLSIGCSRSLMQRFFDHNDCEPALLVFYRCQRVFCQVTQRPGDQDTHWEE